jgi:hypothetical protein
MQIEDYMYLALEGKKPEGMSEVDWEILSTTSLIIISFFTMPIHDVFGLPLPFSPPTSINPLFFTSALFGSIVHAKT